MPQQQIMPHEKFIYTISQLWKIFIQATQPLNIYFSSIVFHFNTSVQVWSLHGTEQEIHAYYSDESNKVFAKPSTRGEMLPTFLQYPSIFTIQFSLVNVSHQQLQWFPQPFKVDSYTCNQMCFRYSQRNETNPK